MRTIMLAILLFAAGYGSVMLGQKAGAYAAGNEMFERLGRQVRTLGSRASDYFREPSAPPIQKAAPAPERKAGFTEYLDAANAAFAAMDDTCSEADRTRFGRAFYDLVAYTKGYSDQTSQTGSMKIPGDLPPDFYELEVINQFIDATRRGVLRKRHFRPAAGKSVFRGEDTRHRAASDVAPENRPGASDRVTVKQAAAETAPPENRLASQLAPRLTRCPPATQ